VIALRRCYNQRRKDIEILLFCSARKLALYRVYICRDACRLNFNCRGGMFLWRHDTWRLVDRTCLCLRVHVWFNFSHILRGLGSIANNLLLSWSLQPNFFNRRISFLFSAYNLMSDVVGFMFYVLCYIGSHN
jgi:hypothetical protein